LEYLWKNKTNFYTNLPQDSIHERLK